MLMPLASPDPHAAEAVDLQGARFHIGMDKAAALDTAARTLAVVPVEGVDRVFLYPRDASGQPSGDVLGALAFENSRVAHIRKDLGILESDDAVVLGRRIAAAVADSRGTPAQPEVVRNRTEKFSTGIRTIVEIHLRDRILRLASWESWASGTTSAFGVTEHYGDYGLAR